MHVQSGAFVPRHNSAPLHVAGISHVRQLASSSSLVSSVTVKYRKRRDDYNIENRGTPLPGFHAGFFAGWGKLFGTAHVKQVVREAHPTRGVWGHPPQKFLKNNIQSGGFLAAKLTAPKFPSHLRSIPQHVLTP